MNMGQSVSPFAVSDVFWVRKAIHVTQPVLEPKCVDIAKLWRFIGRNIVWRMDRGAVVEQKLRASIEAIFADSCRLLKFINSQYEVMVFAKYEKNTKNRNVRSVEEAAFIKLTKDIHAFKALKLITFAL